MNKMVLDASAVLAVIGEEEGAAMVMQHSQGALISTVNLAEVYSKSRDIDVPIDEISWAIGRLQLIPVPLSDQHALLIGSLRESTRKFGLSLGDRACLALGLQKKFPVLTADRGWTKLGIDLDVRLFRGKI